MSSRKGTTKICGHWPWGMGLFASAVAATAACARNAVQLVKKNIDLQFCTDVYAVVTYICDYYSKDETGMTQFLKDTLK